MLTENRQSHDQRYKIVECCRYDSRTPGRYLEERKAKACRKDWSDALEGCLVSSSKSSLPDYANYIRIPFERALDFANKEKITEQLYPLFVHDIGALLYHPSNQPRAGVTGGAMAAVDRRRTDQRYIAAPQTSQPPSLHHHHSISNPMGGHISQPPHSIAPHPTAGRPILDRAHTFPTPPTSASSLIGMGSQGSSYEWSGTGVSGMQGNQPLSIDTGLSNARSVPTTPASTPPGNMQGMPQYQTSQGYDNTRPIYNSAPQNQQGQYGAQTQGAVRYGAVQPVSYPKSEMAPPARAGGPDQQTDAKPTEGMLAQAAEQVGHAPGDEEAEHEHDNEYTHTSASYGNNRSYGYNPNAPSGPMHAEHSHISTEMTGSPHQNGSGRATPRTTGTSQTQWTSGYSAPNRGQQAPSSNLYNVMSDTRSSNANGNTAPDAYSVSGSMTYPSQTYAATNGVIQSSKRGRDDDEEDSYGRPRTDSAADDIDGLKRRKTITESSGGGAIGSIFDRNGNGQLQRTRSAISQRRR